MLSARRPAVAALFLAALLFGCAAPHAQSPATPPEPTPPQITVAGAVNALAQTLDAAITALQSARDNGKISSADVKTAEIFASVIASTGKAVNQELRSADDWPTQKVKILRLVSTSSLKQALADVPPTAAAMLAASVAVFNEISAGVGGPTL